MTETNGSESQAQTTSNNNTEASTQAETQAVTDPAVQERIDKLEQSIAAQAERNDNKPASLEAQLAELKGQQSESFAARTAAKQEAATVSQQVEELSSKLRVAEARERATALGFTPTIDAETGAHQDHEAVQIALSTPDPQATLAQLAKLAPAGKTAGRTIGTGGAAGAAGGEDALDRLAARLSGNG